MHCTNSGDTLDGESSAVKHELVKLTQNAFRTIGLDIYRTKPPCSHAGFTYERVRPLATYAPWRNDLHFQAALESVRNYTLVDEYRLFELWSLVRNSKALLGDIVEVGVWRGGSGALLARAAQRYAPAAKVFLCDTFEGVVKASPRDSTYGGGEYATSRTHVEELLARLELFGVVVLQGVFPDETAAALAEKQLRMCHVDVDVYESARDVLCWAWPRLVPGGIVVFDDYGFLGCDGVTRVVDEAALGDGRVFVHNLNGHGVLVKTS
jgi:O-methyltransferase